MYKTANILLVIIIAAAVGVGGYFIGLNKGEERAEARLQSIIDTAYPEPAEVINKVGGKVIGIQGGTINIEITDPDDYLPHPDGTEQKKVTRFANVGGNTEIILVDYTNPQPNGKPAQTSISLSEIKKGDAIKITSKENIREEKSIDVTKVELIKT